MNVRAFPQLAALSGVILVISACTAAQPNSSASVKPTPSPTTKALQILSDPPGARIEINDNYVGETPITVQISLWGAGFTKATSIRAIPVVGGQYLQSKFFSAKDEVPDRIFFEMNLGPAQ
jgi:PEGA domain